MGILTEDMKRLVSEQRLGFVATVCPDGTPNLSPKGTTAVWDDDHIVFADIRSPATVSNLRRNPSAEINVVDPMVRKGYRFKGVASVVTEGALYERILDFYRTERNLDEGRNRIRSFVLVKINEAMPLISPAYDQGLTEEQVREKMQHYFDSCNARTPLPGRRKCDWPLPGTGLGNCNCAVFARDDRFVIFAIAPESRANRH